MMTVTLANKIDSPPDIDNADEEINNEDPIAWNGKFYFVSRNRYRPLKSICSNASLCAVDKEANNKLICIKKSEGNFAALKELRILRFLRHDNISGLSDVQFRQNDIFLVTEYLNFNGLEFIRCSQHSLLTESDFLSIMNQITLAVGASHQYHVLHKNLVPENILLDLEGSFIIAKLTGFEHAEYVDKTDLIIDDEPPNQNFCYLSPEALLWIESFDIIFKRDIWSLGCTFFELISKSPLFFSISEQNQLHSILEIMNPLKDKDIEFVSDIKQRQALLSFGSTHGIGLQNVITDHLSVYGSDLHKLLLSMLEFNPNLRLSAQDASNHTAFSRLATSLGPKEFEESKSTDILKNQLKEINRYKNQTRKDSQLKFIRNEVKAIRSEMRSAKAYKPMRQIDDAFSHVGERTLLRRVSSEDDDDDDLDDVATRSSSFNISRSSLDDIIDDPALDSQASFVASTVNFAPARPPPTSQSLNAIITSERPSLSLRATSSDLCSYKPHQPQPFSFDYVEELKGASENNSSANSVLRLRRSHESLPKTVTSSSTATFSGSVGRKLSGQDLKETVSNTSFGTFFANDSHLTVHGKKASPPLPSIGSSAHISSAQISASMDIYPPDYKSVDCDHSPPSRDDAHVSITSSAAGNSSAAGTTSAGSGKRSVSRPRRPCTNTTNGQTTRSRTWTVTDLPLLPNSPRSVDTTLSTSGGDSDGDVRNDHHLSKTENAMAFEKVTLPSLPSNSSHGRDAAPSKPRRAHTLSNNGLDDHYQYHSKVTSSTSSFASNYSDLVIDVESEVTFSDGSPDHYLQLHYSNISNHMRKNASKSEDNLLLAVNAKSEELQSTSSPPRRMVVCETPPGCRSPCRPSSPQTSSSPRGKFW